MRVTKCSNFDICNNIYDGRRKSKFCKECEAAEYNKNRKRCTTCGDILSKVTGYRGDRCSECVASLTYYCAVQGCLNEVKAECNMCYGCRNSHRIFSEEYRSNMSKVIKEGYALGNIVNWQKGKTKDTDEKFREWHEKGCMTKILTGSCTGENASFYGRNHSEETKKRMSDRKKELVANGWTSWQKGLTKETDVRLIKLANSVSNTRKSKGVAKGIKNPRFGKPRAHGKKIYYNGICFKSTWEAKVAKYFDNNNIIWKYEQFRICIIRDRSYLPDFIVYDIEGNIKNNRG